MDKLTSDAIMELLSASRANTESILKISKIINELVEYHNYQDSDKESRHLSFRDWRKARTQAS